MEQEGRILQYGGQRICQSCFDTMPHFQNL